MNVGQAKTDLSRLLARVEAGEEVEIARDGVPVARLVRAEPAGAGTRALGPRTREPGPQIVPRSRRPGASHTIAPLLAV